MGLQKQNTTAFRQELRNLATHFMVPVGLHHKDFSGLNLSALDFSKLVLRGSVFDNTLLQSARFVACDLRGTSVIGASGRPDVSFAAAEEAIAQAWGERALTRRYDARATDDINSIIENAFEKTLDTLIISGSFADRARALTNFPTGYGPIGLVFISDFEGQPIAHAQGPYEDRRPMPKPMYVV
ncbi:MAG: hypothetical protein H7A33_05450 [Deltaproteobacteria bacterium]|nr:hypothetical protein [Deltaproteobacteria bacterium]